MLPSMNELGFYTLAGAPKSPRELIDEEVLRQHGVSDFVSGHSFSGACNKRSMALRNKPPRWPSLTR